MHNNLDVIKYLNTKFEEKICLGERSIFSKSKRMIRRKIKASHYKTSRHRREIVVQRYPFLSTLLEKGVWSLPGPDSFTTRKETRYPLYRRNNSVIIQI